MRDGEHLVEPLPSFLGRISSRARLGDLYGTHAPEAYRLAYLLTGDKEEAADIVQDAFVRLFGRFADLRESSSFPAYLRQTVMNLVTDRFRRLRLERAYEWRERAGRRNEGENLPDVDTREAIGRALHQLPIRQRAALVLRFYEDLSERQTADILGCSVAAVKGLVSRGLSRIKDLSEGEVWT